MLRGESRSNKKNKPANHQLLKDFAFGIEKILDQLAVAASAMGVDVYSESTT